MFMSRYSPGEIKAAMLLKLGGPKMLDVMSRLNTKEQQQLTEVFRALPTGVTSDFARECVGREAVGTLTGNWYTQGVDLLKSLLPSKCTEECPFKNLQKESSNRIAEVLAERPPFWTAVLLSHVTKEKAEELVKRIAVKRHYSIEIQLQAGREANLSHIEHIARVIQEEISRSELLMISPTTIAAVMSSLVSEKGAMSEKRFAEEKERVLRSYSR